MKKQDNMAWENPNYNPGISVEQWVALLNDPKIFYPDNKIALKCWKDFGAGTCKQLSKEYGREPVFYSRNIWQPAKRVYGKTNCVLRPDGDCLWFQILCLVRKATRDEDGSWVWKLRDELSHALDLVNIDEFPPDEEEFLTSKKIDLRILEKAARHYGNSNPSSQRVTVQQFHRSKAVKRYAQARANGHCQLCGEKAPFCDADGTPYLEVHHIIWLAQGGSDTIENTVALCPNCHKKMHVLNNPDDRKKLNKIAKEQSGE